MMRECDCSYTFFEFLLMGQGEYHLYSPIFRLRLSHPVKMCSPMIASHFSCPSFIPSSVILMILLLLPDPVMKSRRQP